MSTLHINTAFIGMNGETFPSNTAGIHIRINGTRVTETDETGKALINVPAGTVEITAIIPSTAIGKETVTLEPGENYELTLVLDDSKTVVEETELVLYELKDSAMPISFESFVLTFMIDGKPHPLTNINYIQILHPEGGHNTRIEELFTLADTGEMVVHDLEAFRIHLKEQPRGAVTIRVQCSDEEGFTHHNEIEFYLAN